MAKMLRWAKHPETQDWYYALWLPDYFDVGEDGVRFMDGSVFSVKEVEVVDTTQAKTLRKSPSQLAAPSIPPNIAEEEDIIQTA